jgi:hypothetical protein
MGTRKTILLLVLFFGGLGALWWARRADLPTAADREEMARRVLPQLLKVGPEAIVRIEVEDPGEGGKRVAVERRGPNRWQVVEPIEAMADARRVEVLVNNLRELRRAAEAGEVSGDPSRFGLETPDRVVRLYREGEAEPVATLALGDELERLRYVRPEGGPITLADGARVEPDDVDPDEWRERGLFDIYSYDVKSIDVVGPDRRLGVELDGSRWRVVAPFRAPANAEAVNGLLADLAELEALPGAEGFVAEDVGDLAPYGLDPPRGTITLVPAGLTGSDEPQVAHLGSAPEGRDDVVYARRDGQDDVLLVRSRGLAEVGIDPQAMRSRKVVDFRPEEVAAVRVEADGREYRLIKGREGWSVLAPGDGPADAVDIATLLETIVALESAEFFGADTVGRPGLDEPTARFDLWLSETGIAERSPFDGYTSPDVSLAIGRHDAGTKLVFGQLQGDEGTVLALPETVLEAVPEGELAFRDRTMVRQDPRTVRRVSLERDGRSLAIERPPASSGPGAATAWQVVEPAPAAADRLAVTMLVDALARLRADRVVASDPGSLGRFGLETPAARVEWEAESGEDSRRALLVGGPVPGRKGERYARLDGEPGVFTIGPKLLTLLASEFRDRRMIAFAPEQANRLVIRGGGAEFTFEKGDAGAWRPRGGGGSWPPGYDQDVISNLITALSTLTAERIVQDEGPMPEGSALDPPGRTIEVGIGAGEAGQTASIRLGATLGESRFAAMGAEGPGAAFLIKAAPFNLPVPAPAGEELPEDPFEQGR